MITEEINAVAFGRVSELTAINLRNQTSNNAPSLCFKHDVDIDAGFVAVGANGAFSERLLHGQSIQHLNAKCHTSSVPHT